jgi:predicted PurR-regulated permease PerM
MQKPSLFRPFLILTAAAVLLTIMHLAASFLVPILLAVFFAMLLTPVYRWLKRMRIPAGLALILTVLLLVLIVVFLVLLVGNSMNAMVTDLAQYADKFSQQQAQIESWLQSNAESINLSQITSSLEPSNLTGILSAFLGAIASVLKSSVIILFVILFVLAEGSEFIRRLRMAFGEDHYLPRNVASMAHMMVSYFGLRAVVNLVVATATGLMFWAFGIPNAGLWAVLTFFLSFIPYIGSFIAGIPPILLAYAEGGLSLAITVVLLMLVINSLTENIVAPMIMGKGFSISPTVVFISFLFWMFILGGPGALIAMPLTLGILMFMRSFEETATLVKAVVIEQEPIPQAVQESSKA